MIPTLIDYTGLQQILDRLDREIIDLGARLAALEQPAPETRRALWIAPISARAEDLDELIARAGSIRITDLLFSTYYDGAYYPSKILRDKGLDRLSPLVAAATAAGIRVWPVLHPGYYYQDWPEFNVHRRFDGAPNWLDFGLAPCRSRLADAAEELIGLYPQPPGVVLDHCRWWVAKSAAWSAFSLSDLEITETAEIVADRLHAAGRALGIAVVGDPVHAAQDRGQHWTMWGPFVDRLWAMCYESNSWITTMHGRWVGAGLATRIEPIVTACAFGATDAARPAADTLDQIRHCAALDPAPAGLALYSAQWLAPVAGTLAAGGGGW